MLGQSAVSRSSPLFVPSCPSFTPLKCLSTHSNGDGLRGGHWADTRPGWSEAIPASPHPCLWEPGWDSGRAQTGVSCPALRAWGLWRHRWVQQAPFPAPAPGGPRGFPLPEAQPGCPLHPAWPRLSPVAGEADSVHSCSHLGSLPGSRRKQHAQKRATWGLWMDMWTGAGKPRGVVWSPGAPPQPPRPAQATW